MYRVKVKRQKETMRSVKRVYRFARVNPQQSIQPLFTNTVSVETVFIRGNGSQRRFDSIPIENLIIFNFVVLISNLGQIFSNRK